MADFEAERVLFREVQRFRQAWLWALMLLCFLVLGYLLWGVSEAPDATPAVALTFAIMWVAFGWGGVLFLFVLRLVTEVRRDGIYFRFFPFHLSFRRIAFEDVKSFYARTYRPILEYGGWGIRWSPWRGWAYNVSGNRGVQLELRSGKRVLIGSQRPEELAKAIEEALGAVNP